MWVADSEASAVRAVPLDGKGEVTTIVGLAAITLIGYNGLVQKPKGDSSIQFGTSLSFGYLLALLAAVALVVAGGMRTLESGGGAGRKPPATF